MPTNKGRRKKPKRWEKPADCFVEGIKTGMIMGRHDERPLKELFESFYGIPIVKQDISDKVYDKCVAELEEVDSKTAEELEEDYYV